MTATSQTTPQARVYQAIELYQRFRKGAERNPSKPLHQAILQSRLVVARAPNLDKLKPRKVLSVAPFEYTTVVFWTDPVYQGLPMAQSAGWQLAAMLWDDVNEQLFLFHLMKDGRISLVPRTMTEKLHDQLRHHLAVIWSGLVHGNPTKEFWGKTKHCFTKKIGEAPEAWHVLGSYRNDYSNCLKPTGERAYRTDVRASLKVFLHRGKKAISPEEIQHFESLGYTFFDADEMLDDQTARLLLERGHKDKRAGEWLAVKVSRSQSFEWGAQSCPDLPHVPATRISTN